jgi:glycosyltransferase A (GT-A) superfamily protein (DUF2064 family)
VTGPGSQAVAVIAKAPVAGQVKTWLIPQLGPEGAARAAAAMLADTLATVARLDADRFLCYAPAGTRARRPGWRPASACWPIGRRPRRPSGRLP